jgi:hypothetical protein
MSNPIGLPLHLAAQKLSAILVQNFPDIFDAFHGLRPVVP